MLTRHARSAAWLPVQSERERRQEPLRSKNTVLAPGSVIWIGPRRLPHLDRTLVNKQAIQLLGGLGRSLWSDKRNRRNATAGTVLVVGQHDPLDRASGLVEVVLFVTPNGSVYS